jgi:hypothetical protein
VARFKVYVADARGLLADEADSFDKLMGVVKGEVCGVSVFRDDLPNPQWVSADGLLAEWRDKHPRD